MENLDDYVLVKFENKLEYVIMDKEGCCLLIDDTNSAQKFIEKLLQDGVEIFEDHKSYKAKYPGISHEERLRRSKEWLENAKG